MVQIKTITQGDFVNGISNEINKGSFWFCKDLDIDTRNPFVLPSYKLFLENKSENNPILDEIFSSTIFDGKIVATNKSAEKIIYKGTNNWDTLHTMTGVTNALGVCGDTDKSSGTEVGKLYYASNSHAGMYAAGGLWTDNWQAFTVSNDGARVPILKFLKYMCFGNKNYLATWDIGSSAWNAARLTLPLGYNITWMKAKTDYLVICAHHDLNGSMLFLWDGDATTYNLAIPLGNVKSYGADMQNDEIYTITSDGWISRLASNSYLEKQCRLPDFSDSEFIDYSIYPDAIKFYQGLLLIGLNGWSTLAKRYMFGGIWAFNPLTKSIYHKHSISSGEVTGRTITSILPNDLTNSILRIVWTDGTNYRVDVMDNDGALNVITEGAILVTDMIDCGDPAIGKRFKMFILNFLRQLSNNASEKIIVRCNTSEKYVKKVVSVVSGSTNYFVLTGSNSLDVNVGDEVVISEGDGAGNIRNIIAKEASGANWKYTVDSALSSNKEYSSSTYLAISEFFKIEPEILGSENINATHRILRFMKRSRKIQFKIEFCNPPSQTESKTGLANWSLAFIKDVILK